MDLLGFQMSGLVPILVFKNELDMYLIDTLVERLR